MTTDVSLPKPEEVGTFYDATNDLMTQFLGGSTHYGYWTGPDDESTFEQAADRLTDILTDKLGAEPGQHVLDVGCGQGRPGVRLATRTGAEVTGISISARDVEVSNERAQREGVADRVRFQRADAMELPFADNSFDHVFALESIVCMPDRVQALRQFARVVRPGGVIALTDFTDRDPEANARKKEDLAEVGESWHTAPLIKESDYPTFAAEAGLEVVEVKDITLHTRYTEERFYGPLREYAANNDVPPEITQVLEIAPSPEELRAMSEGAPSVGVALVVLRRPANG
ncbi:cyclopropane fatty-acyl-phospholipid synthase-like methyltransferase [Saccharothrix coeruleofusca]|uniref:methyltransferase domain-containing protein n=1 Tax=Saccharothrix coeruleofusca TaxID=33919 RepID=UPI001AE197C8|nr:methyltransferase domain-containing protein [Saccharothrix coeruleofusca]MBP2337314.1 cyclopropane fatty-acyl-phospholipid synthase-like methyltransferase [Saccharothrix coeruleofusca]